MEPPLGKPGDYLGVPFFGTFRGSGVGVEFSGLGVERAWFRLLGFRVEGFRRTRGHLRIWEVLNITIGKL